MFTKKIPAYYILIATVMSGLFSVLVMLGYMDHHAAKIAATVSPASVASANGSICGYNVERLKGYHFIKPLMFADQNCESERYAPIKARIAQLLENYKSTGQISSASVYLHDFNQDDWTSLNGQEQYNAGSLLKVPVLITYLRMAESEPGLLNKELLFANPYDGVKKATIVSEGIELGHKYTIRQLLRYMIAYSDNNANYLLNQHIDVAAFKKTFTDLGLAEPDWNAVNITISTKEYSVFMEALYNGAYLNFSDSEFATELLSECNYKAGLMKGLPANMKVAHKFGESGNMESQELHESGIIYYDDSPYLLTVMTKGPDITKLPKVIGDISKLVYNGVSTKN